MIDCNSSDDRQGKSIDQSSQCAEENNQPYIYKESLQSDQFADDKNAGKWNDWIRKKISQERTFSHPQVEKSPRHRNLYQGRKVHEDPKEDG